MSGNQLFGGNADGMHVMYLLPITFHEQIRLATEIGVVLIVATALWF